MPLDEDVRQAATMKVGISTYVATAALAVMAGTLVIYTFVASSFQAAWLFHALIFLGLLLLVLSVFIGGRESGRITDAIAYSNWDPKDNAESLAVRFDAWNWRRSGATPNPCMYSVMNWQISGVAGRIPHEERHRRLESPDRRFSPDHRCSSVRAVPRNRVRSVLAG